MNLGELKAQCVRETPTGTQDVDSLDTAQGLWFLCPGCQGHGILVWFANRGVSDGAWPTARWEMSGSSLANLTLKPSINLDTPGAQGCRWHGWITGGVAR